MYIYVYVMIKYTKNATTTEQIVNENSIVSKIFSPPIGGGKIL